jgi:hypothetical protein
MSATNSFASVVMIANVLIHTRDACSFQFSQSRRCRTAAWPWTGLTLEETVHQHDAAVSAFALIGLRPRVGSLQR